MNAILMSLLLVTPALAQAPLAAPTLKSVLLAQLKTTHDQQDWFVAANNAVAGLAAEQASWKDGNANHSIAQLVQHLVFWNQSQLASWKGQKGPAYSGKNDETFGNNLDKAAWENAVRQLDGVLADMENGIAASDER